MILKESEIGDKDIIEPVLGKPFKEPGKLLTATGSSYFFIKEISDLEGNPLPLKRENMKGIFQRYEKGFLLLLNGSNYQNAILIPEEKLTSITLSKIIEERQYANSLIFKAILHISRIPIISYLMMAVRYKARETQVSFKTDLIKAKMYTSFSSFDNLVRYFSHLNSSGKLKVIQ